MKHTAIPVYLKWLLLAITALTTACATVPQSHVDYSHLKTGATITISSVNSDHYGSTGATAAGGLIGRSIAKASADSAYLKSLNDACMERIKKKLSSSSEFKYVEGNAEYRVAINLKYEVKSVLPAVVNKQPLALLIVWSVLNNDGQEVANIETLVAENIGSDVYPSTTDPKNLEKYKTLTESSAEDFLSKAAGKSFVHTEKSMLLW
jgi:hypothetical protein